jgi:hypothetical protein
MPVIVAQYSPQDTIMYQLAKFYLVLRDIDVPEIPKNRCRDGHGASVVAWVCFMALLQVLARVPGNT